MPTELSGSTEPVSAAFVEFLSQFVTDHKLAIFQQQLQLRTRHFTVALEDLRRTHNASACLRSCDGFGIQDVHIIEKRYRYRVNRDIERGSAQWLTLIRHTEGENNSATCMRALRDAGYRIVATSPRDDAVALEEFDFTKKSAFFFGRERDGLSDLVLNEADDLLRIPMYGFSDSFNISVAEDERAAIHLAWLKQTIGYRFPQLEKEFHRRRQS